MATIDDKSMIDKLIEANGYYEDDPRVHRIVEYENAYGVITWGVTWVNNIDKDKYLIESIYVRKPRTIWLAK